MSIEKETLDSITAKDKGKAAITAIQRSAPNRTMLFSFITTPNHYRYGLTGQVLSPRKVSLYVDAGERINAPYKRIREAV